MRRSGGRAIRWTEAVTQRHSQTARPPVRLTAVLRTARPPARLTAVFLLFACTPVTTRPDFFPALQAPAVTLMARPERVPAELPSVFAGERIRLERINVRDGYMETARYDTRT